VYSADVESSKVVQLLSIYKVKFLFCHGTMTELNPEVRLKGWGKEIVFDSNEMYCGKILFDPNSKFSIKTGQTWFDIN